MKKIVTILSLATVMLACNNAADKSAATTSGSETDTLNKAAPPPPVSLDTPNAATDTAKVKKAMRK